MKLLKHLFLLAAMVCCCSYCQAQEFDSITVDTSTYPGTAHVRIKFPHDGYQLSAYYNMTQLSYPSLTVVSFFFKECSDENSGSISDNPTTLRRSAAVIYDTTVRVYADSASMFVFSLCLDINMDPNCVIRTSIVQTDTVQWNFGIALTSVKNTAERHVVVYPNPVTKHKVKVTTDANVRAMLLYDLQGSLLASYIVNGTEAEIEIPPHVAPGNYLLQIRTANGEVGRKLLTVQ